MLLYGVLVCIGMFGFGYALVPMYNVFCNALGINGKTNPNAASYDNALAVDKNRLVTVIFDATNNDQIAWEFGPGTRMMEVHPGQQYPTHYFAQNNTKHAMTVQAIPSVTPGIAAKYLRKTECFCFDQQTLASGEALDMPMVFYLDPDLPKEIESITLSYTLFDATGIKGPANKTVGKIQ
jgi:cytochrome c oxidase assembly protein subunit 11